MLIKQEQNSIQDPNCERVLSVSWEDISGDMPGWREWKGRKRRASVRK